MSQALQFDVINVEPVPFSDYQRPMFFVKDQMPPVTSSWGETFEEYVTREEQCIPFSFAEALADWEEGRVVEVDIALGQEPPEL